MPVGRRACESTHGRFERYRAPNSTGNHWEARQWAARFLDTAEPFDVALNAATKHLKLLVRAELIEREKRGREVLISLGPEPLRLVSGWVHQYERF